MRKYEARDASRVDVPEEIEISMPSVDGMNYTGNTRAGGGRRRGIDDQRLLEHPMLCLNIK